MGFSSENNGNEGNVNWVIPLRAPLKPIYTGSATVTVTEVDDDRETTYLSSPTTPTSESSRIPSKLPCPPPPRKRKSSPALRCKNNNNSNNGNKLFNGKREFFVTPPDLETIFIRRHNLGC